MPGSEIWSSAMMILRFLVRQKLPLLRRVRAGAPLCHDPADRA
jgi:hypothetical protein